MNASQYFQTLRKTLNIDLVARSLKLSEQLSHLNCFVSKFSSPIQKKTAVENLHGIPFAAKDNFCVSNTKTTCCSDVLSDFESPYTATVVQRLLDAGAVLIGKTTLDEFAMGSFGVNVKNEYKARNPWLHSLSDNWLLPGGSSSGSAVCVAAGIVPFAIGSDTGGSIRIPAALCGVVGFKPSYGALSRHGLIALANSLDCPGFLSRTVGGVACAFHHSQGIDTKDQTSIEVESFNDTFNFNDIKIGVSSEFHVKEIPSEAIDTWSKVLSIFETSGSQIIPVALDHTRYTPACYASLCFADVSSNMARYDGFHFGKNSQHHLREQVRGRIQIGNYILKKNNYGKYFLSATKLRRIICNEISEAFGLVDFIVTPIIAKHLRLNDIEDVGYNQLLTFSNDVSTMMFNLNGSPALVLPCGLSDEGLPLGIQIVAAPGKDWKLLAVAAWLENKLNFSYSNIDSEISLILSNNK